MGSKSKAEKSSKKKPKERSKDIKRSHISLFRGKYASKLSVQVYAIEVTFQDNAHVIFVGGLSLRCGAGIPSIPR